MKILTQKASGCYGETRRKEDGERIKKVIGYWLFVDCRSLAIPKKFAAMILR
jgi:hypothetical protein